MFQNAGTNQPTAIDTAYTRHEDQLPFSTRIDLMFFRAFRKGVILSTWIFASSTASTSAERSINGPDPLANAFLQPLPDVINPVIIPPSDPYNIKWNTIRGTKTVQIDLHALSKPGIGTDLNKTPFSAIVVNNGSYEWTPGEQLISTEPYRLSIKSAALNPTYSGIFYISSADSRAVERTGYKSSVGSSPPQISPSLEPSTASALFRLALPKLNPLNHSMSSMTDSYGKTTLLTLYVITSTIGVFPLGVDGTPIVSPSGSAELEVNAPASIELGSLSGETSP
ncbi:MAG: hypothetical protein M1814_004192 [Vezdaea aestivalis]|nr:MAG: hypothetical protein M1814_004192 [Vezdaea aestivalis]